MSDMRIQYSEEMVGAGHPTKLDTLNRLALVEADEDGHGLTRYLKAQAADPDTAAGECVLYAKTVGGHLGIFLRGENNGAVNQVASNGRLLPPPRPVASWSQYLDDPASPDLTRLGPFQVANFAYSAARRLGLQEPALVPGLAHRLMLDLAMSTTATANITLRLAYRVFAIDGSLAASLTTDLWRASWTPGAGRKIVALASDGWREYTAGASGTSGSTPPTWPTSGSVGDGTVTWTAGNVIYKNLTLTYAVSDSANEPFRVDSASLTIPAAEVSADNQQIVGFLLREVSGGHSGDLYLIDGHLKALEA
jgi:hypothetical protein